MTSPTLADLREYDPSRHLGFDAFMAAIACPLCRCTKSGSEDEPNRPTEACEDGTCACHAVDPADCGHDHVETDDIADGVVGGGRSHVYASLCLDCRAAVERDEDGGWTVLA